MANFIGDVHEVELLDGRELTVRPLSISRNRKALKKLGEDLPDASDDNPDPLLSRMLDVFEIAFEGNDEVKDLVPSKDEVFALKSKDRDEKKAAVEMVAHKREQLEDTMDRETLKFIIKVTVGFDLDAALEAVTSRMMEEMAEQAQT